MLLDLDRRAVCTRCGIIGTAVRPNWSERPRLESLNGAQWRHVVATLAKHASLLDGLSPEQLQELLDTIRAFKAKQINATAE